MKAMRGFMRETPQLLAYTSILDFSGRKVIAEESDSGSPPREGERLARTGDIAVITSQAPSG
jgi:hypothetical protein